MTAPSSNTSAFIIRDAAEDAGLVQEGTDISPAKYASYFRRLNDLINLEQTQGLKLWLNEDVEIPLTAGVPTYSLGPTGDVAMLKPTRIIQAYCIDLDAASRRSLTPLSWNDWLTLATVDQEGSINSYFVNKQQSLLYVSTWLTPDANQAAGEFHVLLQNQVTNAISLTEEMEFPVEWRSYLRWGLANEISTNQPETIQAKCAQMAQQYRELLENWDVEDPPTRFTPDPQMMAQNASRFR